MSQTVSMPVLGESVTEGTITAWLKQVGEVVALDEPLLEVSTDKVDTEVPSPVAGVLLKILVSEDETVPVGTALAVVGSALELDSEEPRENSPLPEVPNPDIPSTVTRTPDGYRVEWAYPQVPPIPPQAQDLVAESPKSFPLPASIPSGSVSGSTVQPGLASSHAPRVEEPVPVPPALPEASSTAVPFVPPLPPVPPLPDAVTDLPPAPASFPEAKTVGASAGNQPIHAERFPARPSPAQTSAARPSSTVLGSATGDYATPLVRKLAAKKGVDLTQIKGTGVGGRIRKQDVLDAAGIFPETKSFSPHKSLPVSGGLLPPTPQTSVPQTSVPQTSVPQTSVPQTSAPQTTETQPAKAQPAKAQPDLTRVPTHSPAKTIDKPNETEDFRPSVAATDNDRAPSPLPSITPKTPSRDLDMARLAQLFAEVAAAFNHNHAISYSPSAPLPTTPVQQPPASSTSFPQVPSTQNPAVPTVSGIFSPQKDSTSTTPVSTPAAPMPPVAPATSPASGTFVPARDSYAGQPVLMPSLGESVTEGTVTAWLKKVGETVTVDEPLLEVSTDKIDTEVPSPVSGTISRIMVHEDETVKVGAILAYVQ